MKESSNKVELNFKERGRFEGNRQTKDGDFKNIGIANQVKLKA